MSSNNSNNNNSGGGEDADDRIELIIAGIALAISIVALIIAMLQALQQYFASAEGYSQCSEKIIGDWSKFTERKLRLKQFRFEVRFRIPVIFVAPPYNSFGPLGDDLGNKSGKEIVYLDGTPENYRKTHTYTLEEFDEKRNRLKGTETREIIHTADNEPTTWLALLMAIQRMEHESRVWQKTISRAYEVPVGAPQALTLENVYDGHTMVVGVQEKTRSWDTMPDGLKKPYATTTMCHLVEMMAMLGIHWREFDRRNNVYRAQGNGFLLTGSMVSNLGVSFTFEKTGKTWFQENRIVPNDRVKQLCFGFCPTIFQGGLKTPLFTDEPKDEGTLQLATRAEVAETLVSFKCTTNTVNYFRLGNEHTRYSHVFPITFEMLGMVGEVLQIHHTMFTMLPNPTFFTWDKEAFSLIGMLRGFRKALNEAHETEKIFRRASHLSTIREEMQTIIDIAVKDEDEKAQAKLAVARQRHLDEVKKIGANERYMKRKYGAPLATAPEKSAWVLRMNKLSAAVKKAVGLGADDPSSDKEDDESVDGGKGPEEVPSLQRESFPKYLEKLHHTIKRCDLFLAHNYDLVKYVFALHMQEVLCYLNSRPNSPDDEPHESPSVTSGSWPIGGPTAGGGQGAQRGRVAHIYTPSPDNAEYYNEQYIPLHAIDTASWNTRHWMLMQLYVAFIRKRVMLTAWPLPTKLDEYIEVGAEPEKIAALNRQDSSALSALADAPTGSGSASTGSSSPTIVRANTNLRPIGVTAAVAGAAAPIVAVGIPSSANEGPAISPVPEESSTAGPSSSAGVGVAAGVTATTESEAPEAPRGTSVTAATAAVAAAEEARKKKEPRRGTTKRPTRKEDIEDIWCTLVFRMICWLMLHDFHKKDVQVPKSDVYDSRLAVYIL
ncbi:hypothetical protein SEUCBS139899_006612 [Sporothrix eucalyptigena]|uniref:Modin n=1 Tax=Sporothrix eucalyptigena TaxID=1812306 RepID=A0ABP0B2B1_9PEZI